MCINNYNSLYKTGKNIEPFIETDADEGYKKIPLGIKGVYIFKDRETRQILYAGKAKDLRKRIYQYTHLGYGKAFDKYQRIADKHYFIDLLVFKSDDNYLLEDYFIKKHNPPFNTRREL